ncbi:serine protease easter-like isoform X2 [Anastrepha ludens]|uniref:serine protease easter-like isoform X2 n=1 Tax=Anastrepha ludens TaxID=28586 RepID=UPI0023AF4FD2|nr:serine protease easter-like isoform X2 [Anastrepha ludens]
MLRQVFLSVIFVCAFSSSLPAVQVNHPRALTATPNFGRCKTPHGMPGSCIILQNCKKLYKLLLIKPISDVNKLYLSQSQCGYWNGKILICCPIHNTTPSIQPKIDLKPIQSSKAIKKAILLKHSPTESINMRKVPLPGQCGQMTTSRIYGGNATKIDEYPWMALIGYKKQLGQSGYHCGGSLINARYVVTASHCVNGRALPSDWKISTVRLGEWDTTTNPDCEIDSTGAKDCAPPHIDVPVELAIPHPKYDPLSINQINDIALLRLKETVIFTDFVRPICLPLNSNLHGASFDDTILDVAGWGKTESQTNSNIKLKAELDVVPLKDCRNVYRPQGILLKDTQMCAGGKRGVDSCRGDSGGPLIGLGTTSKGHTYFFLIGIVSFGPATCGMEGWPGVYTRVSNFVDWIQATIRT